MAMPSTHAHKIFAGPERVRIIEVPDKRGPDNRGCTVYHLWLSLNCTKACVLAWSQAPLLAFFTCTKKEGGAWGRGYTCVSNAMAMYLIAYTYTRAHTLSIPETSSRQYKYTGNTCCVCNTRDNHLRKL